jgi:hypothetical protein
MSLCSNAKFLAIVNDYNLCNNLDMVSAMVRTVSVNGYEFKCDFTYQPHERASRHYPGATECVEIDEVFSPDGLRLEEWALELIQEDLEIGCLEAVQADQLEAQLDKGERKVEAWEERQRLQFEQWE